MRELVIPTFFFMSDPMPRALERLAAVGVRLAELHGDAPDTHADLTDEAAVAAVARAVEALPQAVHSVHSDFSNPNEETRDITQPDAGGRAAALRNRKKVVEASAVLGARHVIVHPGVRDRSGARLARSRESLAELAEAAEAVGARIAVENLPPDHLGGSLAEMERVLDGSDPAVVGFCLDTGHAMLGEDSVGDYIRALGDRMLGIHWHGNDSSDDAHLFPDVNQADWDDFFIALDEVGYDLPVTVEAVPPETTPLDEALRSVRAALQEPRTPRRA